VIYSDDITSNEFKRDRHHEDRYSVHSLHPQFAQYGRLRLDPELGDEPDETRRPVHPLPG
jgi:hypothetical protein